MCANDYKKPFFVKTTFSSKPKTPGLYYFLYKIIQNKRYFLVLFIAKFFYIETL